MTSRDNKIQSIIEDELSDLRYVVETFNININRSLRLLHESARLAKYTDHNNNLLGYLHDTARASIVFLHSSLETSLREIIRLKLIHDGDISNIPLAEQSGFPNRREKFTLNDLAKYRGWTVDKVIEESVNKSMSHVSFNSTKDITDNFAKINFPQSTLQPYYADIDSMISRRHQIVHEGDMKRQGKSSELEPINIDQVAIWINSTANLNKEIILLALDNIYLNKIMNRLNYEGIQVDKTELSNLITVDIKNVFPNK